MIIQILSLALFAQSLCAAEDTGGGIGSSGQYMRLEDAESTRAVSTREAAASNQPSDRVFQIVEQQLTGNFDSYDGRLNALTPGDAAYIDMDALHKDTAVVVTSARHAQILKQRAAMTKAKIEATIGITFLGAGLTTGVLNAANIISDQHALGSIIPLTIFGACSLIDATAILITSENRADRFREFSQRMMHNLQKLRLKKQQLTAAPRATDV